MCATLFLIALACGQQQEKAVTAAEKKQFFKLLATLPTRGEFYAEEAITKAAPHTRVLLALTEKDLEKYDLYPFVALGVGLMEHKEARQYIAAHFEGIAHPQIKLSFAVMLFRQRQSVPGVIGYLHKALESQPEGNFGLGPEYQDFREQVIRAHETGKLMKVNPVKKHAVRAFPEFGGGQSYTNQSLVFAPGGLVHAVRPHHTKQCGELITYEMAGNRASSRLIPQPAGFKPKFDFPSYFDGAVLVVNTGGDLLCSWMIEGNGDHGFALLKKGAAEFSVKRVASYLMGCRVVPVSDGTWYVVQNQSGFFNLHKLDNDLRFTALSKFRGRESADTLDARFISRTTLHILAQSTSDSLRAIDFDVKELRMVHNREMLGAEPRVVNGMILQASDGSLHYLWGIRGRRDSKNVTVDKLYCQAEAKSAILKVGDSYHFRATALGDRIIVCYTNKHAPNQVSVRVIRNGVLGPVTELPIAKNREHNLWSEDMVLHAERDQIWFVNTLQPNTLHELKVSDLASAHPKK